MRLNENPFCSALKRAGIYNLQRYQVSGILPDFSLRNPKGRMAFKQDDYHFFILKPNWQAPAIMRITATLRRGHIVGYITDPGFVKDNPNLVYDWVVFNNLPLFCFDIEKQLLMKVGHTMAERYFFEPVEMTQTTLIPQPQINQPVA